MTTSRQASLDTTSTPSGAGSHGAGRLPILLAFAAIYIIWGSTYLVIKISIETIPPFLMAGFRFLVAGLALYAFLRFRGTPKPTAAHWRSGALVGVLMMFGGNGLVTWAEQTVPSGLAALMVTTVPLWMVALDALFFRGPKPGAKIVIGLVLGLVGVATLIGTSEGEVGTVPPVGAAVLLLATLCWALGSLRSRTANVPKSPWMMAATQMIGGGLALFVAATFSGEWARLDVTQISWQSIAALAYLMLFGSIIALSAYVYLLRETTAASVGTYAFVNPVIALLLGWWAGEGLSARSLVGATLVIGSVVLIHWSKTVKPASSEAVTESEPPAAESIKGPAQVACVSESTV